VRLQAARQKARDRRIALDVGREARDRRIEDAAAHVFTRLEQRAEAEQTIAATNAAIGEALTRLAGEGLSVEAVAELLELDVAEVRRLSRMAASTPAGAVGGEDRDAGRRAG
jgi:DNA-directed RNA polymerase specialized sigma24 family protein